MGYFEKPFTSRHVIVGVSLFWVAFANLSFFRQVIEIYGLTASTIAPIASLAVVLWGASILLLTLLTNRWIFKPMMATLLILGASVAYFADTYDIVVDTEMITNVLQTNVHEASDLLSWQMLGYIVVLGILPSWVVFRLNIVYPPIPKQLVEDAKTIGVVLGVVLVLLLSFSKFYTSFFREHKPLRYYANPPFCLYSMGKYTGQCFSHPYTGLKLMGQDAKIPETDKERELIILVVGEAARWDHFSLNGYGRETNPMLKKEDVINFTQFTSCGTETAVSVPCMFSSFGREGYEKEKALHTEDLLDVLQHAGVNVLWRDNNSDSKGVAVRAPYEDFKVPEKNPMCENGECRDEGMLVGLQEYIDAHPKGDIVIVLHQMGNHGPAYYKRYPAAYEKFKPVCKSNQLEQCTQQEITNAYDNAILYTDAFLAKVIALLKKNDPTFETAMLYVSDHGESLGEKGLYLHGFPYAIAPEAQKHVPAILWFGKNFAIDKEQVRAKEHQDFSHDNYFHTVLSLVEIRSTVYKPELDILHGAH